MLRFLRTDEMSKRREGRGEDEGACCSPCARCGATPRRRNFSLSGIVPETWITDRESFCSASCAYSTLLDRHRGSPLVRDGIRPRLQQISGGPVGYVPRAPRIEPAASPRPHPALRSMHLEDDPDAMAVS